MRYVALLRGINVGGNTMVSMAELKTGLEGLGFENVASYINSGNLAFDTRRCVEDKLVAKIEAMIATRFELRIPVMIRERTAIKDVLTSNPFGGQFESHKQMHVLFMKGEMPMDKQRQLTEQNRYDEKFAVRGREIFALLRNGVADSLLGKGFIEKKLRVPVTARNWRTVEKIVEL
jgi:uncharacterized protein (DUF1697 family)